MAKIIQLTGTSGTGKTTIQNSICQSLEQAGYTVSRIVEPGQWKKKIKRYRMVSDPFLDAMLFAFDRLVNYTKNVQPWFPEPGRIFVSDRGLGDFYVHQGMLGQVPIETLQALSEFIPIPDMTFALIVDGKEGERRCKERYLKTGKPLSKNEKAERIGLVGSYYSTLEDFFPNTHVIDTTNLSEEQVIDTCLTHMWTLLGQDLSQIKAIGFDLDNTLYEQTEEIAQEIRSYICLKAAEILGYDIDRARDIFFQFFDQNQSGSLSLVQMGISDRSTARGIVNEALAETRIEQYLRNDPEQVAIMHRLSEQYVLFLITTSSKESAEKKLRALGIDPDIFSVKIYGDSHYVKEGKSAFEFVSSTLSLPFYQIFFLGDRPKTDIVPPFKLGIKTGIIHGESEYAHYQIERIGELEDLFLN